MHRLGIVWGKRVGVKWKTICLIIITCCGAQSYAQDPGAAFCYPTKTVDAQALDPILSGMGTILREDSSFFEFQLYHFNYNNFAQVMVSANRSWGLALIPAQDLAATDTGILQLSLLAESKGIMVRYTLGGTPVFSRFGQPVPLPLNYTKIQPGNGLIRFPASLLPASQAYVIYAYMDLQVGGTTVRSACLYSPLHSRSTARIELAQATRFVPHPVLLSTAILDQDPVSVLLEPENTFEEDASFGLLNNNGVLVQNVGSNFFFRLGYRDFNSGGFVPINNSRSWSIAFINAESHLASGQQLVFPEEVYKQAALALEYDQPSNSLKLFVNGKQEDLPGTYADYQVQAGKIRIPYHLLARSAVYTMMASIDVTLDGIKKRKFSYYSTLHSRVLDNFILAKVTERIPQPVIMQENLNKGTVSVFPKPFKTLDKDLTLGVVGTQGIVALADNDSFRFEMPFLDYSNFNLSAVNSSVSWGFAIMDLNTFRNSYPRILAGEDLMKEAVAVLTWNADVQSFQAKHRTLGTLPAPVYSKFQRNNLINIPGHWLASGTPYVIYGYVTRNVNGIKKNRDAFFSVLHEKSITNQVLAQSTEFMPQPVLFLPPSDLGTFSVFVAPEDHDLEDMTFGLSGNSGITARSQNGTFRFKLEYMDYSTFSLKTIGNEMNWGLRLLPYQDYMQGVLAGSTDEQIMDSAHLRISYDSASKSFSITKAGKLVKKDLKYSNVQPGSGLVQLAYEFLDPGTHYAIGAYIDLRVNGSLQRRKTWFSLVHSRANSRQELAQLTELSPPQPVLFLSDMFDPTHKEFELTLDLDRKEPFLDVVYQIRNKGVPFLMTNGVFPIKVTDYSVGSGTPVDVERAVLLSQHKSFWDASFSPDFGNMQAGGSQAAGAFTLGVFSNETLSPVYRINDLPGGPYIPSWLQFGSVGFPVPFQKTTLGGIRLPVNQSGGFLGLEFDKSNGVVLEGPIYQNIIDSGKFYYVPVQLDRVTIRSPKSGTVITPLDTVRFYSNIFSGNQWQIKRQGGTAGWINISGSSESYLMELTGLNDGDSVRCVNKNGYNGAGNPLVPHVSNSIGVSGAVLSFFSTDRDYDVDSDTPLVLVPDVNTFPEGTQYSWSDTNGTVIGNEGKLVWTGKEDVQLVLTAKESRTGYEAKAMVNLNYYLSFQLSGQVHLQGKEIFKNGDSTQNSGVQMERFGVVFKSLARNVLDTQVYYSHQDLRWFSDKTGKEPIWFSIYLKDIEDLEIWFLHENHLQSKVRLISLLADSELSVVMDCCDLNGDGKSDLEDRQFIKEHLGQYGASTRSEFSFLDINRDAVVNTLDLSILDRILTGRP